MAADMTEYFGSEECSDIILRINGKEDIKTHKIVLTRGSPFFKAQYKSGWKAETGVLWPCEDDMVATRYLIKHLYGFAYYVEDHASALLLAMAAYPWKAQQCVAVYSLAEEYQVPDLCAEAKAKFAEIVATMPSTVRYVETFSAVVEDVYLTHKEEDMAFRDLLVAQFVPDPGGVELMEEFGDLLKEVPGFAFDVTVASIAQARMRIKKQQYVGGKRKRGGL